MDPIVCSVKGQLIGEDLSCISDEEEGLYESNSRISSGNASHSKSMDKDASVRPQAPQGKTNAVGPMEAGSEVCLLDFLVKGLGISALGPASAVGVSQTPVKV